MLFFNHSCHSPGIWPKPRSRALPLQKLRQETDPNFAKKKGERGTGRKRAAEAEAGAGGEPGAGAAGQEQAGGMMPPPPKRAKAAEAAHQQEQQPAATAAAAAEQAPAAPAAAAAARAEDGGAGQPEQQGGERRATVTAKGLNKDGPNTVFVKHLADEVGGARRAGACLRVGTWWEGGLGCACCHCLVPSARALLFERGKSQRWWPQQGEPGKGRGESKLRCCRPPARPPLGRRLARLSWRICSGPAAPSWRSSWGATAPAGTG